MSDLHDIAQRLVDQAQSDEQVEVYVARGIDTDIAIYEGDIESLSRAESLGAGIRVIKNGKQGFAYAGTLDAEVLQETLADARDNVEFASYDEFAGVAQPDGVEAADLDLWRDELLAVSTDDKIAMAMEVESLARQADSRISGVKSADYGDGAVEAAIASTSGITVEYRNTGCYVSAAVLAGEGDETKVGGGYSVGRAPSDLITADAANDAVLRAVRLLGARKPQSQRLTVVFENRVAPTLLSVLASALNGENVLKGRSFLADRVGEQVAAADFTLVDDPTNPLAYAASAYDGEGLATRPNVLIENGVLRGFLYDSYAARRAGRASSGAAVRGGFKGGPSTGARAMSITPGDKDEQQIIAGIDNGVFIQSLSGVHSGVNPVSGDFSVGGEGLMIRNGLLSEPVREFTIASTIQRMLQSISAIGSDIMWLPGAAAGVTLAIDAMSMSGE